MRERLKELAKGGKTFSVRDILQLKKELMSGIIERQKEAQTFEESNGVVDSRTTLMEKMRLMRQKGSKTDLEISEERERSLYENPSENLDARAKLMEKMKALRNQGLQRPISANEVRKPDNLETQNPSQIDARTSLMEKMRQMRQNKIQPTLENSESSSKLNDQSFSNQLQVSAIHPKVQSISHGQESKSQDLPGVELNAR